MNDLNPNTPVLDKGNALSPESCPHLNLELTGAALAQIQLMFENDFTLKNKFFRIQIEGKGCDGFTYATGFTEKTDQDLEFVIRNPHNSHSPYLILIMDSFTAFYLKNITLDFIQDFEKHLEGFLVINHDQDQYRGKFWTDDPSKIPPAPQIK